MVTLLELPSELLDQICGHVLPPRKQVNLSQLAPFHQRWSWEHRGRRHSDPAILYVNKLVSENTAEVFHERTFIIDINCGSHAHAATFDPAWRGASLTGRFRFDMAKKIILRVGIYLANDAPDLNHLFDHMIYMCGVLSSSAEALKTLRVEFSCGAEQWEEINPGCSSFSSLTDSGFAERSGLTIRATSDRLVTRIKHFMQPLGLLKRVSECEISFPGGLDRNTDLQNLREYYIKSVRNLTDNGLEGCKENLWLWKRYQELIHDKSFTCRERENNRQSHHYEWLARMTNEPFCRHTAPTKKRTLWSGNDAKCEGCQRRFRWLLECRKCEMRVCVSCRKELREQLQHTKATTHAL
ncbi:MAG: hypothetical protein Q9218_004496 [Villophora microphyllina]